MSMWSFLPVSNVPLPGAPCLRCSFCDKSQYEVRKLIAGPTVFICEECILVCVEILIAPKVKLEAGA